MHQYCYSVLIFNKEKKKRTNISICLHLSILYRELFGSGRGPAALRPGEASPLRLLWGLRLVLLGNVCARVLQARIPDRYLPPNDPRSHLSCSCSSNRIYLGKLLWQ